jgi:predicted tellurium resistance membrane protein TerC
VDQFFSPEALSAFFQIIMIDLVLAGDNAVVIGLAAAGLPKEQRNKAILIGILAATVMRICFALVATLQLLVIGLLLAGGVLLLWVCWKMWRELRTPHHTDEEAITGQDLDGDGKIAGQVVTKKTFARCGSPDRRRGRFDERSTTCWPLPARRMAITTGHADDRA